MRDPTEPLVIDCVSEALTHLRGPTEVAGWILEPPAVPTYTLGLDDLAGPDPLRAARKVGWAVVVGGPETGIAHARPGGDGTPRFSSVEWGHGDVHAAALASARAAARPGEEVRLLRASAAYRTAAWLASDSGDRFIPILDGLDPVDGAVVDGLPVSWADAARG